MAGSNAVMAYLSQPVEKHTLLPLRPTPPRTPPWPRRGYRPRRRSGPCDGARSLFDHLIGAQQKRWAYRKAERLRGLEVHDHLKFCRELNGKLRWLCAA